MNHTKFLLLAVATLCLPFVVLALDDWAARRRKRRERDRALADKFIQSSHVKVLTPYDPQAPIKEK